MYFALINLFLSDDIKFCILKVFYVTLNTCSYIYNISLDKGYTFLCFLGFCDENISDFSSKCKIILQLLLNQSWRLLQKSLTFVQFKSKCSIVSLCSLQ